MTSPKPHNVEIAPPSKIVVFDSKVELVMVDGTVKLSPMSRATAPPLNLA
ncbi:unannotated protein [freshwater metagenome]|uniref:Unannotated protein n=1 Tax=freshwater metagenome TaxID=449393 RepID=A0A6J7QBX3_9ZZZZ